MVEFNIALVLPEIINTLRIYYLWFYQICKFDMSIYSHAFSDGQITYRSSFDHTYSDDLTL